MNLTKIRNFLLPIFIVSGSGGSTKAGIEYPYHATPERRLAIVEGYKKIVLGMNTEEVEAIIGKPDEIRSLYEPMIKAPEQIGFTYWYIIQRIKESGSVSEKDEKLVRVSFDLDGTVIRVDRW